MNRRSFFQTMMFAVGAVAVLPSMLKAEERRRGGGAAAAGGGAVLVDPKDPAAAAVHYVHHTKDMKDKTLQTERNGVKFAAQHCNGCQFYDKSKETTVNGMKAGGCQMPFAAGKVVSSDGWCTTWAKKQS